MSCTPKTALHMMRIGGIWTREGARAPEQLDCTVGPLQLQYGSIARTFDDERQFLAIEGHMYDMSLAQAVSYPDRLDTAFGLYGYVRYDKSSGELVIGTDRFGYFPMYYASDGTRFLFGSTLAFIKRRLRSRSPDYEAWEELLTLGEVIGEKTTVKQIKRLPHGTRMHITDGRLKLCRYWQPEVPDEVGEAAYIAENNALLGEAMQLTRNHPGRKAVLLSGGEDSRRLALAAVDGSIGAKFYTQASIYKGRYRRYVDRDVKLAAEVAASLNRQHVIEPMPDDARYLADWRLRDAALGFECIAHEWLLPLARRIPPDTLVYDGIVGDVTINGHYFKEFPAAIETYAPAGLARMICNAPKPAWLDELRRRTDGSLLERIEHSLASYPDSPHRLTFYILFNHTRRKIACVSQLFALYGHWTCYPFLYYPLFLQSLAIAPRRQVEKFYQRECMAALAPRITSIPTTRGKLSEEWLIPLDRESERKEDFMLRHLQISDAALELFPRFRSSYRAVRGLRHVSGRLHRKYGWFIAPIARFSAFLEWLESDDERECTMDVAAQAAQVREGETV